MGAGSFESCPCTTCGSARILSSGYSGQVDLHGTLSRSTCYSCKTTQKSNVRSSPWLGSEPVVPSGVFRILLYKYLPQRIAL